MGSSEVKLDLKEADAGEIVDRLRSMTAEADPGFSRFNTLVLVDEEEAFVPAGSKRIIREGEQVVLIPFSHGG